MCTHFVFQPVGMYSLECDGLQHENPHLTLLFSTLFAGKAGGSQGHLLPF